MVFHNIKQTWLFRAKFKIQFKDVGYRIIYTMQCHMLDIFYDQSYAARPLLLLQRCILRMARKCFIQTCRMNESIIDLEFHRTWTNEESINRIICTLYVSLLVFYIGETYLIFLTIQQYSKVFPISTVRSNSRRFSTNAADSLCV